MIKKFPNRAERKAGLKKKAATRKRLVKDMPYERVCAVDGHLWKELTVTATREYQWCSFCGTVRHREGASRWIYRHPRREF